MQFKNTAGNIYTDTAVTVCLLYLLSVTIDICGRNPVSCCLMQNVKGVFDAAIRVVLQPPKQKKKKSKAQKACSILWFSSCKETTTHHIIIVLAHLFLPSFQSRKSKALCLFHRSEEEHHDYVVLAFEFFSFFFFWNLLWSLIVGNSLHT